MDCSCKDCKNACIHKPGWFLPGEAEKVADFLGLTLKELFDSKLGIDWWETEQNIFLLAPAITSMTPGEEYPGEPRGQCVFYEDGKCLIHSVKPFECREYIHTEDKSNTNKRHRFVADSWIKYQNQIKKLLGRKPEAEEYDGLFGGLFGW